MAQGMRARAGARPNGSGCSAGTIHGCCERTRIDCAGLHRCDQSRARSSVECFGKGCQQQRQIIHDDKYVGADRPDFVNHLTSSSALSLVYDDTPYFSSMKRTSCNSDENSTFAMRVRSLIAKAGSSTRPRLKTQILQRAGALNGLCGKARSRSSSPPRESCTPRTKPACCLSKSVKVTHQTRAVIANLALRATGTAAVRDDLSVWHEFQQWIALVA